MLQQNSNPSKCLNNYTGKEFYWRFGNTKRGDGMEEFRRVFYGSNDAMFNVWKKFYGRLETVPDFSFLFKGFTAPNRRAATPENWILVQTGRWDTSYVTDMYTLLASWEHTSEWNNRLCLVLTLCWHL